MALPKIEHPVYKHYLKGLEKEISFRPFTTKEQKILLLAKEGMDSDDDKTQVRTALEQIISNCVSEDIDPKQLPLFDVEDLFMRIRAKSVGEEITLKYKYDYQDENGTNRKDTVSVTINIDDVYVDFDEDVSRDIIVDEYNQTGIRFRWPTFDDMDMKAETDNDFIKHCIEFIFDKDRVYPLNEATDEELDEFLDSIDALGHQKIQQFFQKMPRLYYKTEVRLPKLEETETLEFRGIKDFFI